MDFKILYAIQNIRTPWLDEVMLFITNLIGSYAEIWLVIGAILLIFKKTRKAGLVVLLSYGVTYLCTQMFLKDLIARARPCHIDQTVELLIKRPTSYSCPSTHTCWAFAGATSIYLNHKKAGIVAYIFSIIIGFSRMYMFVHFPTDVLLGVVVGISIGYLCNLLVTKLYKLKEKDAESIKQ